MNICLFGGTFDPVHNGHVAIAQAAAQRFSLKQVLFCPAYLSPFKAQQKTAPYPHRFAMLALALQGKRGFLVSDLESPAVTGGNAPNYTIDTVVRLRKSLPKSGRLFFLCGIDAFEQIAKWHRAEDLLASVEFIVASRPGHSLADVASALPESIRPDKAVIAASRKVESEDLVLRGATIHLLPETHEAAASTELRDALRAKRGVGRFVDAAVLEYIQRQRLYAQMPEKEESEPSTQASPAPMERAKRASKSRSASPRAARSSAQAKPNKSARVIDFPKGKRQRRTE